jgi:holo-[acyl-carrier protein] synthase
MTPLGLGIDLVEIARIEKSMADFGDKFLNRVFCPAELAYCLGMKHPAQHLAARFAAKEAISKALGTGIGEVSWTELEIVHTGSGAPQVELHGAAAALAQARGIRQILVSLTHTEFLGAATAVLVHDTPLP